MAENKSPTQSANYANDGSPRLFGNRRTEHVGRLRLRTLVALRWLAIVGQLIAISVVAFGMRYKLPLTECFSAISASAWFNIVLAFALPSQRLLKNWEATAQIAFDMVQITYLLFLTGGVANPFVLLLIAPTTIAASTLRPVWVAFLLLLASGCVWLLYTYSLPLPWQIENGLSLPRLYKLGLTIGVLIGIYFTAAYAWRVSAEEGRLADALIATQNILAREQRLAAVGGLAAAAAHELGTPLATIQLTAKEMTHELPDGYAKDDAQLILDQSLRCREILRNLSSHTNFNDPTQTTIVIGQLLEEAVSRHSSNNSKAVVFDLNPKKPEDNLTVKRMPEILYGLGNFIENALSYANSKVTIHGEWDTRLIEVSIIDDGKGFDPDILPRLGEPYVSTRGQGTQGAKIREGMGLGFFIAKTLLERSGATISFGNRTGLNSGAIVRIVWSRDDLEIKE